MTTRNMRATEQQPEEGKQERENNKRQPGEGTHTGKIGRLPHHIREQLNEQLRDGKETKTILGWLNSLPETKEVLAKKAEQPINAQNVSDWRKGGYPEWLRKQEALAETRRILEDAGDVLKVGTASLTDNVAVLLSVRLASLMAKLGREEDQPEPELRLLHQLCQDIALLRKGNQGAEWVRIEGRRADWLEERKDRKQVELFLKWYENPSVRATLEETNISYQDKIDMLGQAMFGDYWNPEWRPRTEFPPGQTNDPPLVVRMREEEERKKAGLQKAKAAENSQTAASPKSNGEGKAEG